jgi:AbrB family looped-hinge helix DNA binding protein
MKGICQKQTPYRGITTVSGKGQIVIPAGLRQELKIKRGQRLIVLKRKDKQGFTCLKEEIIQHTFRRLADK